MAADAPLRYHADYREEVTLDDGTKVVLRPIGAGDKALLLEGFQNLSDESRYRRFHGPKGSLSPAELRYLTECDGYDHFAIGAATERDGGLHGLGVARIIRQKDKPDTAEAAITVVDEAQGHGLGRILGDRLVEAARERGISRFRVMLLAENDRARALLDEVAPSDILKPPVETEGSSMTFEVELPEPTPEHVPAWYEAWRRLLAVAARIYALARGE